jgi:hypothetical protein
MAQTLSAKPLANAVAGTDYIVAIVDPAIGATKVFTQVSYTVSGTLPALGASNYSLVPESGTTGIPQLQSLTAVSASDGTNTEMGQLKVTLAPNAADVVNASSPMVYTYSPSAIAITATSTS